MRGKVPLELGRIGRDQKVQMPVPIQVITYIFPTRYFVTILKGIFLRGVGLSVLYLEVGLLALYALLVFIIATKKLRQKVA